MLNQLATTGSTRLLADHFRLDIQFIVSQLGSAHTKALSHLLSYLHGSITMCLTLGGRSPVLPECYVDASYIEVVGYCLRLNSISKMIYSRSIRDSSVSMSSADAEIRTLKEAAQDVIWFRLFLEELGFPQSSATPIYEDNAAVIKSQPRTRHLNKIRKKSLVVRSALIRSWGQRTWLTYSPRPYSKPHLSNTERPYSALV